MIKTIENSRSNYLSPLEALKKDESLFYTLYGPKIRQGLITAKTVLSYLAPVVPAVLIGAYAMRVEAITERVVPGLIASVGTLGLFFLTRNAICNLDGIVKDVQKSCIKTKGEVVALYKSVDQFFSDDLLRNKYAKVAKENAKLERDCGNNKSVQLLKAVNMADPIICIVNLTSWTETLTSLVSSLRSLLKANADVKETAPFFLNKGLRELLKKFKAQVKTELPKLDESKKVLKALTQLLNNENIWAISQQTGFSEEELTKWKEFADSEIAQREKNFGKLEDEDLKEKINELGYRIIVEMPPSKPINNNNNNNVA